MPLKSHSRRRRPTGGRRIGVAAAALAACLAGLLAVAAPAGAGTVSNQRPPLFSFDGSGTTAGKFVLGHPIPTHPNFTAGIGAAAVDDATGDVYVLDSGAKAVDKFDSEGTAKNFAAGSAAGTSSLFGPRSGEPFDTGHDFFFDVLSDLAVDNSGGAGEGEQGRLYVSGSGIGAGDGPIYVFKPSGELVPWSIPSSIHPCGVAVDHEGHVWVGGGSDGEVHEFASSGEPALELKHFRVEAGSRIPCRLGIDQDGEGSYVAPWAGEPGTLKYVGGLFDSALTSEPTWALAVDQTAADGHIFTIEKPHNQDLESTLDEYEPCSAPGCGATLLGSSGPGSIGDGRGVAYNAAKDWVYVPDLYTETVRVFGPRASGAVPDVSEGETDEIGKTEATARGTINPGSLPNTYHFEWVRAEIQKIEIYATGGRFRLNTGSGETNALPFDISPTTLQAELETFYGEGNVEVTGKAATAGVPDEIEVLFKNDLAGRFVPRMSGRFLEPFEEPEPYKGGDSPFLPHAIPIDEVSRGQLWADAEGQSSWPESNPSIEPTDNADHAVSQHLSGLSFNTTYDVRLVGANTEPEGDPEKRLDAYSNADTFTTLPPEPPTVSGLSLSAITTDSAHLSATIDPQEDETSWRLLVDPAASAQTSQAECEGFPEADFETIEQGSIPRGEPGSYALDTELSGLEPGEIYCLRLVAANSNPESATADALFHTLAVPPTEVALAFVAPRTDTAARLNFYVNPEGEAPLNYRFEISADGTSWTPLEELVSTLDAHRPVVLGEEAKDLAPNTAYHYRLGLVENHGPEGSGGAAASLGEEGTFTTRTSAEMTIPPNAFGEAEKRGFELVNDPDKGNQNARAAELVSDGHSPAFSLRADGEEFLWTVLGGAPGANSGTQATFLARRTGSGWVSQSLVPPASEQVGEGGSSYFPFIASPDFSRFVFEVAEPKVLTTGPPTFVRLDASGGQQVLHAYQNVGKIPNVDASADTAHVLLVDPETGKLEDIGGGSEEVSLIPPPAAPLGVPQPGGSPPACGLDREGSSFFGGGGGGGAAGQFENGYHRMSVTDASRVYFQVHPNSEFPSCNGKWALYERNREAEPATTTPILTPAKGTADTAMIRATPEGRSLYFATSAKLDPADANSDLDIYRWDEAAGKSTCLTCEAAADAHVTGRVLISDDFSHVYFDSPNRLVPGHGAQGADNLYVLSAGEVRFVASPVRLTGSQLLSSDGNVLSFLSDRPLTADRIAASCADVLNKGKLVPCEELYRYDARDGSIECLSCRHDGVTSNNVSLSNFGPSFQASADGSTAVFTTVERLVAADVNNSADLYEWRDGAVRLLTDGVTRYPIGFAGPTPLAVDADGSDIVFSVASPGLTGFEQDRVANVYDARIGGGFTPSSPPAHCSEESCQGPLGATPPSPQPGSAAYEGPGNLAPLPSCRKGEVRRKGRCVKRHHHRRHRRHRRTHLRPTAPRRGAGP